MDTFMGRGATFWLGWQTIAVFVYTIVVAITLWLIYRQVRTAAKAYKQSALERLQELVDDFREDRHTLFSTLPLGLIVSSDQFPQRPPTRHRAARLMSGECARLELTTDQVQLLEKLPVKILPAVSSLDCLFVDLAIDPSRGLMMYEANDMLLYRKPLMPDVHCIIWQPGMVESEIFTNGKSRPGRFTRLKEYLLQYYPPSHPVNIVSSASNPIIKPKIVEVPINQLESKHLDLHTGTTLHIPPLPNNRPVDESFREIVLRADHITRITE